MRTLGPVGLYGDHVLPRIVDRACGMEPNRAPRRVCAGLAGDVVEIGFGSGLNVPFYPGAVTRVAAVEPADVGWKLAAKRVARRERPGQRAGLDGQSLPFADDSFDAAVSTWTLCTIPDVAAALARGAPRAQARRDAALRRARPRAGRVGATVAAPPRADPEAAVRRMPPHPADRRAADDRGVQIAEVDVFYEESSPKVTGANSLGVAHAP